MVIDDKSFTYKIMGYLMVNFEKNFFSLKVKSMFFIKKLLTMSLNLRFAKYDQFNNLRKDFINFLINI